MDTENNAGFNSSAEYMKISALAFRYARRKLVDENIWDDDTCVEKAHDMISDVIYNYLKQIRKGTIIENNQAYIMTSVRHVLMSKKFKKEKEMARKTIVVYSSYEGNEHKSIEKRSFEKWIDDTNNIPQENPEDYHSNFFNMPEKPDSRLTEIEQKVKQLKDKGLRNVDVAKEMSLSEGYVSKLVKKILQKIIPHNWI